jgi:hypothetical protein
LVGVGDVGDATGEGFREMVRLAGGVGRCCGTRVGELESGIGKEAKMGDERELEKAVVRLGMRNLMWFYIWGYKLVNTIDKHASQSNTVTVHHQVPTSS